MPSNEIADANCFTVTLKNSKGHILVNQYPVMSLLQRRADIATNPLNTKNVDGLDFDKMYGDSRFEKVRQFYTLFTRAKEATLANIKISTKINNVEKSSSVPFTINPEDVENALKNRLDYLNSLSLPDVEENKKPDQSYLDVLEGDKIRDLNYINQDVHENDMQRCRHQAQQETLLEL